MFFTSNLQSADFCKAWFRIIKDFIQFSTFIEKHTDNNCILIYFKIIIVKSHLQLSKWRVCFIRIIIKNLNRRFFSDKNSDLKPYIGKIFYLGWSLKIKIELSMNL